MVDSRTYWVGEVRLRRDSPLPLYQQLVNVLEARIDAGEWATGERIQSEAELAAEFGVSVVTVRQALQALKQAGRVHRRQGVGTFVSEPATRVRTVSTSVPIEVLTETVGELRVRNLSMEPVAPPAAVRTALSLGAGDRCLRIRRLRFDGDIPITYAVSYIPLDIAGGLDEDELGPAMILSALERRGERFVGATQTIEASLADTDCAAALGVSVGAAVLLVRRTYLRDDGRPGYLVTTRHPAGSFRYELSLSRAGEVSWQLDPVPVTGE